jgi:hypothetical protein
MKNKIGFIAFVCRTQKQRIVINAGKGVDTKLCVLCCDPYCEFKTVPDSIPVSADVWEMSPNIVLFYFIYCIY